MKSFYYILLFLGVPLWLSAQSSTQNYIVGTVPYQAVANPTTLTDANSNTNIQYFDGLGRPSQTVQRSITPSGADLVSGIEYDGIGRDYRHWLSGSLSGNSGAYVTDFGTPAVNTNGGDSKPYVETILESSPLNRPLGQRQPGADWYTHPTGIDYQTNDGSILYFYVNSNNQLAKGSNNYATGTLFVTQAKDEDGKTGYEFKDKQGKVILKRQSYSGGNVDTYYVYNDLSQLSYVIPPKAVDELTSDLDDNNEILKQYCYLYRYDTRGNCIYKRLPGCEPIYMVYDKTNKLLLSQYGNQRPFSKWTMNKYDILGRVIYTAVVIDEGTTYEEELERFRDATVVEWYNTPNAQSDPMEDTGYSRGWYDTAPTRLLTVNYYDDYSFLDLIASKKASLTYDASKEQEGYTAQYGNAKGLLTGTRTYHLDDSTKYEATAFYYDKYGRVVQTRTSNHLLGYDITYNALDFRGKVLKSLKEHNILGQAVIPEVYRYAYDKAERLIMTRYKLGTNDTITLASNTYDELGRVAIKNLGGVDTTSYTYNVRGWTTDITGSRFTENLYYNVNTANAPVFTPCYNGNIAGMQWTVPGENLNYTRTYNFVYDELNRFTNSIYYKKTGSQFSNAGRYDEGFSYDKIGNVNSLFRYENGHLINDLSFTYTGNQLKKVDNAVNPFIPYGSESFKDSINANIDTEYAYDKNGSMISDLNTGISTIQYNILNLPDQIQFIQGHKNLYTYDASGKKLKALTYSVNNKITVPIGTISTLPDSSSDYTTLTTDYVGNMVYENDSLKEILLPDGYYQGGVYYYYLKDHLGNNRVVINSNGMVVEKSHYYPSGMRFYPESTSNSAALPYRYNGKELEAMNGLNQYDYGARRRGVVLPVWTAVDPLCERAYDISPYVYCHNNPVNRIDPDGRVDGDSDSGGTPGLDTDKKRTAAKSSIPNTTPKNKFESIPLKKEKSNSSIAKKKEQKKAEPTTTLKNHHEIKTDLVNLDAYGTTEVQTGNSNVEIIKDANQRTPEAEITTNFGVKLNVSKKGNPTLSGVGPITMGTDGNSITLDINEKIPFTRLGYGVTISVNPANLLPATIVVPVLNAVNQVESAIEPIMGELPL